MTTPEPKRARPARGSDAPGHVPALDGLRGLAILLVMLFHQTVMVPHTGFDRVFMQVFGYGWCGVDLFFVLSGFLITGILLRMKSRQNYFRNFYAGRTLRIFPLYYLVVFISLVLLPNLPGLIGSVPALANVIDPAIIQKKLDSFGRVQGQELWYWAYLSNIPIAIRGFQHGILDISWSLAIEEQFYLLWPTAVFFLSRRNLVRLCFGMIAVAVALRCLMMFALDSWWIAVYVSTPCRWDALAIGALLALWLSDPAALTRAAPVARKGLAIFGILTAIVIAIDLLLNIRTSEGGAEGVSLGYAMRTAGFTVMALAFGSLLVMALVAPRNSFLGFLFQNRAMRILGTYSYALYLFHLPVRAVIRDLVYKPDQFPTLMGSPIPGQILFYVVATLATLALALASWYLFEKPFLNLKKFFPSAPAVTGVATNPQR